MTMHAAKSPDKTWFSAQTAEKQGLEAEYFLKHQAGAIQPHYFFSLAVQLVTRVMRGVEVWRRAPTRMRLQSLEMK